MRQVRCPRRLVWRVARAEGFRRGTEASIMSKIRAWFARRFAGVDALRWAACGLMVAFAGFVGLFVVGYAVTDPGGLVGIGGSAAWVAVVAGLGVWALYRPSGALIALAVLACAPLAFGVWSLLDYEAASNWEDTHGPMSMVLSLTVCAPAAIAGLFRPRPAGYLILVASMGPILLAAIGAASKFGRPLSIGLVLTPIVVSGVLFILAGRRARERTVLAGQADA